MRFRGVEVGGWEGEGFVCLGCGCAAEVGVEEVAVESGRPAAAEEDFVRLNEWVRRRCEGNVQGASSLDVEVDS